MLVKFVREETMYFVDPYRLLQFRCSVFKVDFVHPEFLRACNLLD